ncbi:MAG: DUF1360 domain-containing protein [Chloroflexi bacterium]|mgnify:CR=1 FL=1|nr:DUF1360 domain-containing protein [Chloroflexota bacterium]OJW05591.1 MAG: hypothetical protein BGO39_02960 [Chloroflexi bacterium 54-19]
MPDLLLLFLLVSGIYSLACMVAKEEGPFSIFVKLRGLDPEQKTWPGRLVTCPFCLSVWFAIPAALLWYLRVFESREAVAVLLIFSISGVILALLRLFGQR